MHAFVFNNLSRQSSQLFNTQSLTAIASLYTHVLQGAFICEILVWTQFNKAFDTYTEIFAHVVKLCAVFHICFGLAVSSITHCSYHLTIDKVFQLTLEIKTTSLFVAFQSAFSCSIVAIIHAVNNAHSQLVIAMLVAVVFKFAVIFELTTFFVGIAHVFKVYTASQVALGFKQYVVIMKFYK